MGKSLLNVEAQQRAHYRLLFAYWCSKMHIKNIISCNWFALGLSRPFCNALSFLLTSLYTSATKAVHCPVCCYGCS